jgi:thioredoxin reductase
MYQQQYDVAIVGGGAAGLSAALVLARSRRRVVVLDSGSPRNAPAAHMHNFLSRDGLPPAELLSTGRSEVRGYGGEIVSGTVDQVESTSAGFCLRLEDGSTIAARRLLIATGLTDELPDVPGVRERWGRDVLHCPYCHGYEVRDQALGVLGTGPKSVHQALLVRQLSRDVVFFRHTLAEFADADRQRLAAREVRVVEGPVARLVVEGDRLTGAQLTDGSVVARSAVFVAPRFVANDRILAALGAQAEHAPLATDPTGRTSVPGVWAVGNVVDAAAFVIEAAAAGARAAAAVNADLVEQEVADAMAVGASTPASSWSLPTRDRS